MHIFSRALLVAALALTVACSDDDNGGLSEPEAAEPMVPEFLSITQPTVALAPDIGSPLNLGIFDLAAEGYNEQEYFFSGTTRSFTNLNELQSDGFWEVEPAEEAEHTSRMLVRRPADPARFNGTVIVEWMNVSAGFDTTPIWDNVHVEVLREGYAWIGVTAQKAGVDGREGGLVPFNLKDLNPERYADINHPGDSFSFDIFSQVAQAVRTPGDLDVMDGLTVERLIAGGQSQSAFAMTTYVNAIHPVYSAFDGYIILSRGEYAFPLAVEPQTAIETPPRVLIRTDLNAPVMTIQAETDVLRESLFSVNSRQEDTENLRLWEIAGTSHSDDYSTQTGWTDTGVDPSFTAVVENDQIQGFITCDSAMNSGHLHFQVIAGLFHMNEWIMNGTAPPSGEYLSVNPDQTGFELDAVGNALGGIRTPYVDAPAAVLSGLGQSGDSFCGLFGTTRLLTAAEMAAIHVDEAGYVSAVTEAANAAVAAGFLLQADADLIIAWAPEQWRSAP